MQSEPDRTSAARSWEACALCGRDPAAGFAKIGEAWYCHGDDDPEPTCYMRATWDQAHIGKHVFAVGRRGRAPF